MQRPNIVQIVADDMGYGDLSSVNYGVSSTPALDYLAGEGTVLTQHYSASSVCAPARAALLTGRYPQRGGVIDTLEARGTDRLALDEVTIADILSAAGYATGLVGKWHNGAFDPRYHPNRRGFDEFVGFRGGWQDYWDWRMERNGTAITPNGRYITDVLTDEAVGFVRRHRAEPFYLHLAYNAPHFPFQAPPAEIEPFIQRGLGRTVATIYAMIGVVDRGVARILEELDALGLSANTLVMFSSDNGPQLDGVGEDSTVRYNLGFSGGKQHVLEGGIRVPLIVRWPDGIPERQVIHDFAHFTDWFPTLASVAQAALPKARLDGVDILPILRGDDGVVSPVRFWQWSRYAPIGRCNAAMRDGHWKLVWPAWPGSLDATPADLAIDEKVKRRPDLVNTIDHPPVPVPSEPDDARPFLYDLLTDPTEQHNLADDESARVGAMTTALDAWFTEIEMEQLRQRELNGVQGPRLAQHHSLRR